MLATVTTPLDVSDDNDGLTTLREAIEATLPGGTVNFAIPTGSTITLDRTLGQIDIQESITINGGTLGITISGNDPTAGFHNNGDGIRIFNITDPSSGIGPPPSVTMIGLTLTGADPALGGGGPEGGAIRSEAILTLRDMVIVENGADFGAGVFLAVAGYGTSPRDVLRIEDSIIEHNSAYQDGGAVLVRFASIDGGRDTVRIDDSSLSHNVAGPRDGSGGGGALYITADGAGDVEHAVIISTTDLIGNEADEGGAINQSNNNRIDLSIINDTVISGNTATTRSGGGIYSKTYGGSRLRIEDSTISGNDSEVSGGGLAVIIRGPSSLVIERSTISGNTAQFNGGGVHAIATAYTDGPISETRSITISRSIISGNSALSRGGGVYSRNNVGTETLMEDTRVTNNDVPTVMLHFATAAGCTPICSVIMATP